jgi:hypothetical protein
MTQEERLKKVCNDFSLLSEEKQDYILGIIQALTFVDTLNRQDKSENPETSLNTK